MIQIAALFAFLGSSPAALQLTGESSIVIKFS